MTTGSLVSSQVARFCPFAIEVSSCFPWPSQPNTSPSASLLVDIKICSPKASHGRERAEPIVSMCGSRWPCQRRFLLLTPLFDDTGYGSSAPVIPSQCRTSLKSGRTQARLPAVIASPASTVDQIAMSTVATVKGSAHQTFFPFFLVPRRNPEARAGGWRLEGGREQVDETVLIHRGTYTRNPDHEIAARRPSSPPPLRSRYIPCSLGGW